MKNKIHQLTLKVGFWQFLSNCHSLTVVLKLHNRTDINQPMQNPSDNTIDYHIKIAGLLKMFQNVWTVFFGQKWQQWVITYILVFLDEFLMKLHLRWMGLGVARSTK